MDKESLRKRLRSKRQSLTSSEVKERSQKIINTCWGVIDWDTIQSVHTYLPIAKNNEIDTLPLIHAARQLKPDLKIAGWESLAGDVKSQWLDEDLDPTKAVPESFQFGLIIVPLLGFDHRGHRLGYGGGFYDRFLAGQGSALTIGLCYEFGFVKTIPSSNTDIPLKFIVTEKLAYRF